MIQRIANGMVRMAIHQNHRICGALGAPAGTLYPVRATLPLPLFRFYS